MSFRIVERWHIFTAARHTDMPFLGFYPRVMHFKEIGKRVLTDVADSALKKNMRD